MPFVTIKYPDFYHVRHILLYLKWCVKFKDPYLWLAFQSPYNSVDLRSYPSASSTTNHVTYEEGNAVADQHGSIYCETSALHAEGVTECFNLSVSTRVLFFLQVLGLKCSFIFFSTGKWVWPDEIFKSSSFVLYIHVHPNTVVMLSFIYKNKRFLNF